jgi:hypothetical protein
MRYLICAALALTACGRTETARDTRAADTTPADTSMAPNPAPAAGQTMTAVSDRLLGTWQAKGYDAGSAKAQQFTITWTHAPDGGLVGTIAFQPGETYGVKVLSTSDTTIVYQSDPHRSPTLKGQVVTRSEARFVGDSLVGTYTARSTQGGRVLKGRFSATRGSAPAQ